MPAHPATLFPDSEENLTAGVQQGGRADRKARDEQLLRSVLGRLGLTEPLVYRSQMIPIERLVVRHIDRDVRLRARQIAASFRALGVQLEELGVVKLPPSDAPDQAEGYFEVCFGRARREAAEIVTDEGDERFTALRCNVYELPGGTSLVHRVRALLAFSENLLRSEPWVEALRNLVELRQGEVPLTEEELARASGLSKTKLRPLFRFAQLPTPILEQVFDGQIRNRSLLQRIVSRLLPEQITDLAERARAGETVDKVLVDHALRGALGTSSLTSDPVQAVLGRGWDLDTPLGVVPLLPSAVSTDVGWTPDTGAHNFDGGPVALEPDRGAHVASATAVATAVDGGERRDPLMPLTVALQAALPDLLAAPRFAQAAQFAEALLAELEPALGASSGPAMSSLA